MFTTLRSRLLIAAAGTAVALTAGGGATAAFAAPHTTTATTAAHCTVHVRAIVRAGMPTALRKDLKALRAEPKDQRAADRAAIRTKALAGTYGDRVEALAKASKKGDGWFKALPATLRTDLKALRALEPKSDARKAKAQAIVQKAIAGGYGTQLQQRAKRVQAHVQARCAAKG